MNKIPSLEQMKISEGCRDCYPRQVDALAQLASQQDPSIIRALACPILAQLGVLKMNRTETTDSNATGALADQCVRQGLHKLAVRQYVNSEVAQAILARVYDEFAPYPQFDVATLTELTENEVVPQAA